LRARRIHPVFELRRWLILLLMPLAGCQSLGFAVLNTAAPHVERVPDIEYAPGSRGRMDLYAPRAAKEATGRPLVVFWYGGSFQSGSRNDYRFVGAALAARGAVTVLPDYRLYPDVRFPEFLRDAAAAVAKAQLEAPRYGADPRRTVLGGHSAGAYIAAMLAVHPVYLREAGVDPASIAGLFGLSGPYGIEPNSPALHAIFTAVAKPEEYQALQDVSPDAPPTLLVHGEADEVVYPSHAARFSAALRARGVPVELRLVPRRRHADTVIALSRPAAFRVPGLLAQVSDFIHRTKR
jgi:acetyl esterase/lipase